MKGDHGLDAAMGFRRGRHFLLFSGEHHHQGSCQGWLCLLSTLTSLKLEVQNGPFQFVVNDETIWITCLISKVSLCFMFLCVDADFI